MVLEYLFLDNAKQEKVKEYNAEHIGKKKITVKFLEPEAKNYLAVKYELTGETKENAKALSDFNKGFTEHFRPITLINDSAEYYNKILYPLVNKFERLLRKLLYVKMAICDNDDMRGLINDLESKDFGEIGKLLFVDSAFCKKAKKITDKAACREDIIAELMKLDEKLAWDIMVGKGTLSIVQENFEKLRDYRNDVMHAHNIDYEQFDTIQEIFKDVNDQLAKEIDKSIEFETPSELSEELAATLTDRLNVSSDGILTVGEILAERFGGIRKFTNSLSDNVESWQRGLETLYKAMTTPINPEVMEAWKLLLGSNDGSSTSDGRPDEEDADNDE